MRSPEQHELLADVLAETISPEFQAEVLAASIRCATQRRRVRRVGRIVTVATACVVAAVLSLRLLRPTPADGPRHPPAYTLVRTQPLSPVQVVHTSPMQGIRVTPSEATVAVVHTRRGGFRLIGDDELMAVLAPRPVLLVKEGPGRESLVFADAR